MLIFALLTLALPHTSGDPNATPEAPGVKRAHTLALTGADEALWTGSFSAGSTMANGNSEVFTLAADFEALRTSEKDEFQYGGFYYYSEQDDAAEQSIITLDTFGVRTEYNRFLGDHAYVLLEAAWEQDRVADLDRLFHAGPGAGLLLADNDELHLALEAGGSFFGKRFENEFEDQYLAARVGYDLTWRMSDSAAVQQRVEFFPSVASSAVSQLWGRVLTRVNMRLTETMFARVSHIADYDKEPAPGKEELDHLFLLTLGWTF